MVLELLITLSKLTVTMIAIGLFLLSLIFRIMSGAIYYYYDRDIDFVDSKAGFIDSINISKKFKPIFKDIKIVPINKSVLVTSVFSKNVVFKKVFLDRVNYFDLFKK